MADEKSKPGGSRMTTGDCAPFFTKTPRSTASLFSVFTTYSAVEAIEPESPVKSKDTSLHESFPEQSLNIV
jgi:hypothetical protein